MRKAYKKYTDVEIPVQLQDLQNLKQEYKLTQPVLYKCVKCNQDVHTVLVTAINSECLCKGCKTKKTWLDKYGTENINALSSKKEKTKQTCLERYGVENVAQTGWMREKSRQWTSSKEFSDKLKESWKTKTQEDIKDRYEKSKKTNLERYGVENPFCDVQKIQTALYKKRGVINPGQLQEVKEKIRRACLEKYGTENFFQSPEIQDKIKQICIDRYGVEHFSKSKLFRELIQTTWNLKSVEDIQRIIQKNKQTCLERYGTENVNELPEIKEKRNQTCLEKYGTFDINSLPEFQLKRKETCLRKYDVDHFSKSLLFKSRVQNTWSLKTPEDKREIQDKVRQTCFEKYGMYHAPSSKYIYDGQSFDSSWELALWIYAVEHNEEIERLPITLQYTYNGIEHTYYPDFKYKNQLIEIKGDFFKQDSEWIHPFDSSLTPVMQAKQQCALENNVQIWYYKDIQFALDYVVQKYTKDYLQLFKKNLPFPYPQLPKNPNDYDLIRCFHKSIYEASKGNRLSPLQAWQDKNLIKKTAINRLKYIGKCRPSDIVQGFNVAKIAPKVSIFKPTLAETLIKKYLDNYKIIFDPFSGFSGRLLGAVKCNKTYIGQDLNEKHIQESQEIIEFKHLQNCTVVQQDILTDQPKTFIDTCLFTCPPYSDKEYWTTDKSELTKTCDEWIDICLEKYKCSEYLFVVDETEKYKDKIVEVIENKSHFGKNNEYVILIKK